MASRQPSHTPRKMPDCCAATPVSQESDMSQNPQCSRTDYLEQGSGIIGIWARQQFSSFSLSDVQRTLKHAFYQQDHSICKGNGSLFKPCWISPTLHVTRNMEA
eukprot:5874043-Amphidinium_carterae.1